MDSGAAPHRSRQLVGLLPSTSPPPLGERNKRFRWTTSHIDSHMMGDHIEGIPEPPSPIQVEYGEGILEPPSPIQVEDGEFTPTYDPSTDLIELGPVISEIGTFHDRPTYSVLIPH